MGCKYRVPWGLNHPKCSGGSGFGERRELLELLALEVRMRIGLDVESGTEVLQEGRRPWALGWKYMG